ncbi:MAG: UDP-N-acetylmuramate dehydrogenase [Patescibacteria group bacterium]
MKKVKITEIIPKIREHQVMRDFTTLRVGGVADYFLEVFTADELVFAVRKAVELKIPYFILGNGSNILFSDYGFPGLVIKNSTANISFMNEKSQIMVDSGVSLGRLITEAVSNHLSGLEFLFGVPGTVGGAVYGNAGAYGSAIGDYVKNVTILNLDPKDGIPKIYQYDRSWMKFAYRDTSIKKLKGKMKPTILSVRFQLAQNQKEEILKKLNLFKEKRQQSQPVGLSCGCIFRNPIPKELQGFEGQGTKGMPELPTERRAGFLLDQAEAKKMKINQAEVSSKHANFIINKDGAKAADIRMLIEEMRAKVLEKFNIVLQEEIEYIGQW